MKNQGSSGRTAPTAKARRTTPAPARPAEPAASGSMPSSRRAWVSRATLGVGGEDASHRLGLGWRHATRPVHGGQLAPFGIGLVGQLLPLDLQLPFVQLLLGPHRHQLSGGHRKRPGQQPGDARQAYRRGVGRRPGHPEDQRHVGDQAVARAEDGGPGGAALDVAVPGGPGGPVSHQPGSSRREPACSASPCLRVRGLGPARLAGQPPARRMPAPAQRIEVWWPAQYLSRIRRLYSLPVGRRGSSSTKSTRAGALEVGQVVPAEGDQLLRQSGAGRGRDPPAARRP